MLLQQIPKIIAHRGSQPENRISGFINGIKQGCHMVECDVRLNRDAVPFVLHDKTINRVCQGYNGSIENLSLDDLSKYDIPSFNCLAKLIREYNITIAVELKDLGSIRKNTILADKVIDIISEHNIIDKSYIISFNKELIKYTKEAYPIITTAIILPIFFKSPFQLCDTYKSDHLWMYHRIISKYLVEKARNYHKKIYAWTVNDVYQMERLCKLGVDGIVTDYPGVLNSLLKSDELLKI